MFFIQQTNLIDIDSLSFQACVRVPKKEVLILSDGQSNCGKNISKVLPELQAKAAVFGLMIGGYSDSGKSELTSYVTKPKPKHLFAVNNYQELKELLQLIRQKIDETNPCAPFDISKK